eukprot:1144702-Pelagomonas_calceolata.AAC.7
MRWMGLTALLSQCVSSLSIDAGRVSSAYTAACGNPQKLLGDAAGGFLLHSACIVIMPASCWLGLAGAGGGAGAAGAAAGPLR